MILALSSCTLLFNPDNFGAGRDGGVEPPPPPSDAEPLAPGEFGVTGVDPYFVDEGEGAAWAVPIVVSGQSFTQDTVVVLNGAGFSQQMVIPVVASDGRSLAFPLSGKVLPGVGKGQNATLTVRVLRGMESAMTELTVVGLDELTISSLGSGPLSAEDFDPLYSRIVIDQDVTLTGPEPVRLVATAEIQLAATITADGQDADNNKPGEGGPGGCPGGNLESNGGCGGGGGRGVDGDDAASGGGHFSIGTPGSGEPPLPPGVATGRRDMVPLENESGNGGGGSRLGRGGGGGGIVELTSYGTFVVESTGRISANGGRGGPGQCSVAAKAGSGGGGSGGAILVRAWGGFDDKDDSPRLTVDRGAGGDMPPLNNCVEVGGAGSLGRVRVDTPTAGAPPFAQTAPEPFLGPMFNNIDSSRQPVQVVTNQQQITLEAFGERGEGFTLDVNGKRSTFTMSTAGAASVQVTLSDERNTICAVTGANTSLDVSEGVQCVTIVYMQ